MKIIKWLGESSRLKISEKFERELFENVFMIKDGNILATENVILS